MTRHPDGPAARSRPRLERGSLARSRSDAPPRQAPAAERRRAADIELLGFREDVRGRWRLPLLFALILLVTGATRFEETRGVLAEVAIVGAPVAVMMVAVAPLREALPALRNAAFATAGGVALLAESILVPHALGRSYVPGLAVAAPLLALTAALVPVEVLAVRRGFALRPAALGGMVAVFALNLPRYGATADPLGAFLAAACVAVFLGGGAGFAAGMVARTATGARA